LLTYDDPDTSVALLPVDSPLLAAAGFQRGLCLPVITFFLFAAFLRPMRCKEQRVRSSFSVPFLPVSFGRVSPLPRSRGDTPPPPFVVDSPFHCSLSISLHSACIVVFFHFQHWAPSDGHVLNRRRLFALFLFFLRRSNRDESRLAIFHYSVYAKTMKWRQLNASVTAILLQLSQRCTTHGPVDQSQIANFFSRTKLGHFRGTEFYPVGPAMLIRAVSVIFQWDATASKQRLSSR
jgi:hypothetical protein